MVKYYWIDKSGRKVGSLYQMSYLSNQQIQHFIRTGFVKVENAFSDEIAAECISLLWEEINLKPDQPKTWNEPVIRINELNHSPFLEAANTTQLLKAYQQLAHNNWRPLESMGSFPIRFPSKREANDTGWHVDASFQGDNPENFLEWKINIRSKGRALLMLFLFSDVTETDAPTKIIKGSHINVARLLHSSGESGLSFMELAKKLGDIPSQDIALATGKAGTVYLCHPFIVHAAQNHNGSFPRFMAQPPLISKYDFNLDKSYEDACPVEKAILIGLK